MIRSKKSLMGLLVSASVIASQLMIPGTALAAGQVTRLYGSDRYATAIAIDKANWTTSDYAVLARGDDFADALCAGPLAKAYNAPILLNDTGALKPEVLAELKSLQVKTVFIAGGTGAISQAAEDALKSNGMTVQRFWGATRYETSEAIAEQLKAKLGTISSIAVAVGTNYPDALSIAPIAAKQGMPILLTDGTTLSDKVKSFISSNSISNSYVVGGSGVISEALRTSLPNGIRLGGQDRYDTNVEVMKQFQNVLDFSNVYLAVGDGATSSDGFPDALAGSTVAASKSAPIVLSYNTLSDTVKTFLNTKMKTSTSITAFGGAAVVPDSVVQVVASDVKLPLISSISLTDGSGNTVNAVIESKDNNRITIDTAGIQKFNNGTASINEDLSSVSISSQYINKTVSNVKASDNFAAIIFGQAAGSGYNPNDGILASNIKSLLNGATITLTDTNGNTKQYTVVVE